MTNVDVSEFLRSSIEDEKLNKFYSEASLWFLGYETVALILALLQFDNSVVEVNIGFLNFVISGLLFLIYEVVKHKDRIDLVIAVFRLLRWYILMIAAAAISILAWFYYYTSMYIVLGPVGFVGQLSTLIPICFACFVTFYVLSLIYDQRYRERIRGMIVNEDVETIYDIASGFSPTGMLNLSVLYLFNAAVFLATVNGDPFNVAFLDAIISMPFLWLLTFTMIPFALWLTNRITTSNQIDLVKEHKKLKGG